MGGSLAVIAAHRPCRPLKFLLRLWWGMLALTSLWLGHTECTRAAQMQHVYSMFPARTGSGLHWCCGIFEMSPDWRYNLKRMWHQLSLSEKNSTHSVTPWGEVQWNRSDQEVWHQYRCSCTGSEPETGQGQGEGWGYPKDYKDSAVLSWVNRSALSVHYNHTLHSITKVIL